MTSFANFAAQKPAHIESKIAQFRGILHKYSKAVYYTFDGFRFLVFTLFARECTSYWFPCKEHGNQAENNIPACSRQGKSVNSV